MVREIVKDDLFLSQKSLPADKEDAAVIQDLIDTLEAHSQDCLGMAANMIGFLKQIIAVRIGPAILILINPKIVSCGKETIKTQEGCLCRSQVKEVIRYKTIECEYLDRQFKKKRHTFSALTAQIIQHEIDHCKGRLI